MWAHVPAMHEAGQRITINSPPRGPHRTVAQGGKKKRWPRRTEPDKAHPRDALILVRLEPCATWRSPIGRGSNVHLSPRI